MAQFGDLIGRLFSTGGSRGLSGDVDLVLADDPGLSFYNEGLRKHTADGDLVSDPSQLWSPATRRKGGLGAHLSASYDNGVIDFTDILLIINREDWARAVPSPTSTWPDEAARSLSAQFMRLCEEQDIHLLFPQRPMQFHIIQDGGPRMEGEQLGLAPGEFVTGLLSNQYGRPTTHSRALIAIHLNLPGTWQGYYEVGRLYNDQALFTLGNHWLDNFSHPALPQPALYRLQQQADGSFIHVIDPNVAEHYELTTQDSSDGPSVLSIQNINGEAVAHLVLEVVSEGSTTADPDASTRAAAPGLDDTQGDPEVTAIYDRPRASQAISSDVRGSRTVVPEAVSDRILTLRERGALLQKVHFSRFMLGYDVYIGSGGEVGTSIRDPLATLSVRHKQAVLISHDAKIRLNGAPAPLEEPYPLDGDLEIDVGGVMVLYRDLRGVAASGWPYIGELRRRSQSPIHLLFNKAHTIGRARSCQVNLPDKPHNDNIVWRPEVGEGATIRARSGDIPKSQFYTDSIMVASNHAEVDLSQEPVLHSRARHCYTFVRRGETVFSLYPTKKAGGATHLDLQPGDQILIGNSVFEVDYLPEGAERRPAEPTMPPPDISVSDVLEGPLSPSLLAAAIDDDDDDDEPKEVGAELPAAHGLGERGPEPVPVHMDGDAEDSILGIAPPPLPEIALPDLAPEDTIPPERAAAPMLLNTIDESLAESLPPDRDDVNASPSDDDAFSDAFPDSAPPPLPPLPDKPPPLSPLDPPSIQDISAEPPPTPIDLPDLSAPPPLPPLASGPEEPDSVFDMLDAGPEDVPPPSFGDTSAPPPLPPLPESAPEPEPEPPVTTGPPPIPPLPTSDPTAPPPLPSIPDIDVPDLSVPPQPLNLKAPPAEDTFDLPPLPEPEPEPTSEPEPTPEPEPAPAPEPVEADGREVVIVDESDWQVELSRPGRLAIIGWMASGNVLVGNHRDAAVILPENRAEPDQTFVARDYFSVFVRGRRAKIGLLDTDEARLESEGADVTETKDAGALMEVVRRDPDGEPDFEVPLRLRPERMLPDPRARLLALDTDDAMVSALFALGFPLRTPRPLQLGRLEMLAEYDGAQMTLTGYLDSYKKADGSFRPFFVKHGDAPFRTAPEDGSPIALAPGDHILVGVAVYRFDHG